MFLSCVILFIFFAVLFASHYNAYIVFKIMLRVYPRTYFIFIITFAWCFHLDRYAHHFSSCIQIVFLFVPASSIFLHRLTYSDLSFSCIRASFLIYFAHLFFHSSLSFAFYLHLHFLHLSKYIIYKFESFLILCTKIK